MLAILPPHDHSQTAAIFQLKPNPFSETLSIASIIFFRTGGRRCSMLSLHLLFLSLLALTFAWPEYIAKNSTGLPLKMLIGNLRE